MPVPVRRWRSVAWGGNRLCVCVVCALVSYTRAHESMFNIHFRSVLWKFQQFTKPKKHGGMLWSTLTSRCLVTHRRAGLDNVFIVTVQVQGNISGEMPLRLQMREISYIYTAPRCIYMVYIYKHLDEFKTTQKWLKYVNIHAVMHRAVQ